MEDLSSKKIRIFPRRSTLGSPFWFHLFGQGISRLGDGVFTIAQAWLVTQLSSSAMALGLVALCTTVPRILISVVGGAWVDRVSPRKALLAADGAAFIISLVYALLYTAFGLTLPIIYLLATGYGLISGFFYPASSALLPLVLKEEALTSGNALFFGLEQVMLILGPVLGGLLLPLWGIKGSLIFNTLSFGVAILATLFVHPVRTIEKPSHGQNLYKNIKEGFVYARTHRVIWVLLWFTAMRNTGLEPFFVLLPQIVRHEFHLGADVLGIFEALTTLGMLLGGGLATLKFLQAKPGRNIILMSGVGGLILMILGVVRSPFPFALMIVFNGLMIGMDLVIRNTLYQRIVPLHLFGRVASLRMVIASSWIPLSQVSAGYLSDKAGTTTTIAASGVLILLSSIYFWRTPALRTLNNEQVVDS